MPTRTDSPLDRIGGHAAAAASQATLVEQSRATAEVAAAVEVAQRFPRDIIRVRLEMEAACDSYDLAREAFYAVPNRGHGPSVHLARELATIMGNFQYGVSELRRDDAARVSEVQAFAWDVERNTRSTRTFISPHQRMRGGERVALTDLGDIYLMNQNTGARAVRECIFAALPKWLVREAEVRCRATLERGEGKPLSQRASDAVEVFAGIGVTEAQLTDRIGRRRQEWTAQDLAALEVVWGSIKRSETTVDEQFPAQRVTAAEVVAASAEAPVTTPGWDDAPADEPADGGQS